MTTLRYPELNFRHLSVEGTLPKARGAIQKMSAISHTIFENENLSQVEFFVEKKKKQKNG